jgi:hypothetical protein
VLSHRQPHSERGLLLVPVLPGTKLRSIEPADEHASPSRPMLPVAVAVVAGVVALIAGAVLLFARGTGGAHHAAPAAAPAAASSPTSEHASPLLTRPHLTAQHRARAAATRLAARLPVTLDSTALLRVGSKLYAVGGVSRGGSLSDAIWEIDLRTGRVSRDGRFVEPLTGAAAASRGGELYLAGGWTGETLATGVLRWSPGQSSQLVTRLPNPLRGASAAFVGGKLYVVTADGSEAFQVDVESGTLTRVSKAPAALASPPSNLDVLTDAVLAAKASA